MSVVILPDELILTLAPRYITKRLNRTFNASHPFDKIEQELNKPLMGIEMNSYLKHHYLIFWSCKEIFNDNGFDNALLYTNHCICIYNYKIGGCQINIPGDDKKTYRRIPGPSLNAPDLFGCCHPNSLNKTNTRYLDIRTMEDQVFLRHQLIERAKKLTPSGTERENTFIINTIKDILLRSLRNKKCYLLDKNKEAFGDFLRFSLVSLDLPRVKDDLTEEELVNARRIERMNIIEAFNKISMISSQDLYDMLEEKIVDFSY